MPVLFIDKPANAMPSDAQSTEVWVREPARAFIEHAKGEDLKVDLVTRDNDQICSNGFDRVITEAGIRASRLALRAPNTNAYVERFMQTIQVDASIAFWCSVRSTSTI